jgi:hypothetical protein
VREAELDGKKVCIRALRLYTQDTGGVTKKVRSFVSSAQPSLKHPVGVLQRSRCVEVVVASQHCPLPRSSHRDATVPDHL